jgi:response regulator RpfG family c-di-GMP phosphodiesterase
MKSKKKPERRPKILAIDDKKDNLVTLSAMLKNLMPGCAVIIAQSGLEGIAKAKAELPDAILLDIKMPDMDGFETCQMLMADESTKRIPVIMITSIKTDPDNRIEGLECGAIAFLSKPIDEYELVSQIKVALRIKKAEDALREERNSIETTLQERTASLRQEITERKLAEQQAKERMKELQAFYNLAEITGREGITLNRLYQEFTNILPQSFQYQEIACARIVIGDGEFRTGNFAESAWMQSVPVKVNRSVAGRIDVGYLEEMSKQDESPFLEEERMFMDAIAERLGRITEHKQAEEELQRTLESLRKAVGVTIQVMASAVETRDPYTAGHQIRSADLARAIASEMGLSQKKIEGLRMAGSIHDIGKLSIPAEILSKPTKLSGIEFRLIKEHARQGYEILKDVESPWPLAEIVYQHHERMDGSGYPGNLKGDNILIEARILAVADVVESMASHRPYRPGLGIDAALEEIEKNKGLLYDSHAVDTCLKLFREKGYQLDLRQSIH